MINYYKLKKPFTSVSVTEENSQYSKITLCVNDQNSGVLRVHSEDVPAILLVFADQSCSVATMVWDKNKTSWTTRVESDLAEDQVVVSSNGQLTNIATLKIVSCIPR